MKKESSERTRSHSAGSHLLSFLAWTFATLVVCVAALLVLNMYFRAGGDEVGNLGGAFQGTIGVAAALAGALVTIKLAVIAIDQSEKTQALARQQNEIAERQARNDDPEYQSARFAADFLQQIHVIRTLLSAHKKRASDFGEEDELGAWLGALPPEVTNFTARFLSPHMIRFLTGEYSSDEIFVKGRSLEDALTELKAAESTRIGSIDSLYGKAILEADGFLRSLISISKRRAIEAPPGFWTYLVAEIPQDLLNKYAQT